MKLLTVNEIACLFKLVLEKLEREHIHHINIPEKEYWQIPTSNWTDFEHLPEPLVCSLSEDIDYLKEAISVDEIFTFSNFDRLATVLRFISEQEAPS